MTSVSDSRELLHFLVLDYEQQAQAIRRLAMVGMSAHSIARATRLSLEQVQLMLAEHPSRGRIDASQMIQSA